METRRKARNRTDTGAGAMVGEWKAADHYAREIRSLLHAAARGDRPKKDAADVAIAMLRDWAEGNYR